MGERLKNKTPSDGEYVSSYLKYHSQNKAAAECGVSRETIIRAVKRAGIVPDGNKFNGGNQPQAKITDEELIIESISLNCLEIAQKHGMTAERVYRRARNLGIYINSRGAGGHYRLRTKNQDVKYDNSVTLKAVRKRDRDICQICGKRVDDTDIMNGHIKRLYPTIDHIIPLSKGGSHTWKCSLGTHEM